MNIPFELYVVNNTGKVLFKTVVEEKLIPLCRGKTKQHVAEFYPTVPGNGNYGDNNEYNVVYDGLEIHEDDYVKIVNSNS